MNELPSAGQWIRARRRVLDLTQQELAWRVGCATITLRKIEAGEAIPSKQLAGLLAEQLGIGPGEREEFIRFVRADAKHAPTLQSTQQPGVRSAIGEALFLPGNLPVELTSFIGRQREIAELVHLIERTRLLTLTGAGGVGKTRLALQVGVALRGTFTDGVWCIELAPLSDPGLVPYAVAKGLGVSEEIGRPLMPTLLDGLRHKRLLLILDNCEHLIVACADFAQAVRQASSQVHVLATSREPLGVGGELLFRVPSLATPQSRHVTGQAKRSQVPLDQLARYDSIRLFVERAGAIEPNFELTHQNAAAVEVICQRLDGIPLAIELAAARINVLSVEQIAERLDNTLRLLSEGSRTMLPRQQTLRATIEWSYNLLTRSEQRLFRRLGVFASGFTLHAAESVCVDEELMRDDVLNVLAKLVAKSLVIKQEQNGTARYSVLEPIREFSREQFEPHESEHAAKRHAQYYAMFLQERVMDVKYARQMEALREIDAELENIRAMWEWALAQRDMAIIRRSMEQFTLLLYFEIRGLYQEGEQFFQPAIELLSILEPDGVRTNALASVLTWQGWLRFWGGEFNEATRLADKAVQLLQGMRAPLTPAYASAVFLQACAANARDDHQAGRAYAEQALQMHRDLHDRWGEAWDLDVLGYSGSIPNPERLRLTHEALGIFRQLGARRETAMVLNDLARLRFEVGEYTEAATTYEATLQLARSMNYRHYAALALSGLGDLARLRADYREAAQLYQMALDFARELHARDLLAGVLYKLGFVRVQSGDYLEARTFLDESLDIVRQDSIPYRIVMCLVGFAALAATAKRCEEAVRLFGAAEALLESRGENLLASDRLEYDRYLNLVRTQLVPSAFGRASDQGRAMPMEEAIAYALASDRASPSISFLEVS